MNYSNKGAARDNTGKAKLSLVPIEAMNAIAEVLWKSSIPGGGKYEPNNWRKGANHSVPLDSLIRHAMRRAGGVDKDEESGLPHSYHMLINAVFLVYYEIHHSDLNDLNNLSAAVPPAVVQQEERPSPVKTVTAPPAPLSQEPQFDPASAMQVAMGMLSLLGKKDSKS